MPGLALNNKFRRKLHICLLVSLMTVLFVSDQLTMRLTGEGQDVREVKQLPDEANGELYFAIDSVAASTNITLQQSISGWAFLESPAHGVGVTHSDSRRVEIFFVSPKISYAIPAGLHIRRDIRKIYPQQVAGLSPDDRFGIRCEFASFPIASGTYELAFFISESDELQGLAYTGLHYAMTGKGLRRVAKDHEVKQLPDKADAKLYYVIDAEGASAKITSGQYISGWAFLESPSSEAGSEYFARSTTRRVEVFFVSPEISYAFPANLQVRDDIRQVFPLQVSGLSPDNNFGFLCEFAPLGMKQGTYELAFSIYENDTLQGLTYTGVHYKMDDDGLKRVNK